jgi:tetratricopeptide (TPR) repeat protein
MKGLFQGSGGRAQTRPGEARLSLAAFGKHPGWDDHISGIGVETEVLAHVKQSLYVGGIGRQIDLGSWEKLDSNRRVEGFDHTFLWFRNGHTLLGRFWSSVDRKGRTKYPMVLCIDSEGLGTGFLMSRGLAELERLRESCQATNSDAQVTSECGAAQDRLRAMLASSSAESPLAADLKQRFVENPALGPGKVGSLRVLHELDNALQVAAGNRAAASAALATLRPYHIRVPLCFNSPNEGLLVWAEFLRNILPHAVSLLLVARNGVDWLDVLVGEPTGEDFFCLQASPQALPLASAIPYELGSDLSMRYQQMESQFLAPDSSADPGGTIFITKSSAPRKSKGWLWLVIGLAVVAGAVGGIYFALPGTDRKFQAHLQAAQKAVDASNFSIAQQELIAALQDKPNEPAATALKTRLDRTMADAEFNKLLKQGQQSLAEGRMDDARRVAQQLQTMRAKDPAVDTFLSLIKHAQQIATDKAAAKQLEEEFQAAVEAAKAALAAKKYDLVIQFAQAALKAKPGDADASSLLAQAQNSKDAIEEAARLESDYTQAISSAKSALTARNFDQAIQSAQAALKVKASDAEASRLMAQAKSEKNAAEQAAGREHDYQQAIASGNKALRGKNYDQAVEAAQAALQVKPGDSGAGSLLKQAQEEKDGAQEAARKQVDYDKALATAKAALDSKDLDSAIKYAQTALTAKPGDADATGLLTQAQQLKSAQDQASLAEKQPVKPAAPPTQTPVVVLASATAKPSGPPATPTLTIDQSDIDLRNLMILFHVRAAGPNVLTNGGTQKPLPTGNLGGDAINYYTKKIGDLRKSYQDNNWLDAERKKDLDRLSDAVLSWD